MSHVIKVIVPLLIALGPGLAYLTYAARLSLKYWVVALIGGAGWFLAFILRIPVLPLLRKVPLEWRIPALALTAGFLEEGVRYLLLKDRLGRFVGRPRLRRVIKVFGVGWGLTEALIIFAASAPLVAGLRSASLNTLLAGAVERNSAIILHLGLTFIIGYGILRRNKWFLAMAIILHSTVDFVTGEIALNTHNVWVVELLIALIVLSIAVPVITLTPRVLEPSVGGVKE